MYKPEELFFSLLYFPLLYQVILSQSIQSPATIMKPTTSTTVIFLFLLLGCIMTMVAASIDDGTNPCLDGSGSGYPMKEEKEVLEAATAPKEKKVSVKGSR